MSYNYGLLIDGKDVEVGDILHDHDYAAVCSMDTSGSVVTAVVRYVNGETGRAAWGTRALMMVTRQEGACDRCDAPYTLGSDDHDGETGLCWACSREGK